MARTLKIDTHLQQKKSSAVLCISVNEGRILLRESSQGESSGLRVRLEGSLRTHYDAYLLPANIYSLLANVYLLH